MEGIATAVLAEEPRRSASLSLVEGHRRCWLEAAHTESQDIAAAVQSRRSRGVHAERRKGAKEVTSTAGAMQLLNAPCGGALAG